MCGSYGLLSSPLDWLIDQTHSFYREINSASRESRNHAEKGPVCGILQT